MKAGRNRAVGLQTSIRSPAPTLSRLVLGLVIFGVLHAGMVEKAWGDLLFARTDYDVASGPRFIASGDLDRDGDLDLAVASSGVVSIYSNNRGRNVPG